MRTAMHLLTGLCALVLGAGAHAQVTSNLQRATFQAAIAGSTTLGVQDFDDLAAGGTLLNDGFVTYGSSTGSPLVTASFLTSTPPNGLGRTGTGFFDAADIATFTFANPITAFAIDINTFATAAGSYQVLLNTGDTAGSIFEVFPGAGTGQFIGLLSDTPFTSITLSSRAGGFGHTLDTLIYGAREEVAGVIPEPSTWAMMIIGFGVVGGAMRRRRAVRVSTSYA